MLIETAYTNCTNYTDVFQGWCVIFMNKISHDTGVAQHSEHFPSMNVFLLTILITAGVVTYRPTM
jgi:hypothetical protein